ncbi:AAA family ATPase [Spirosoma lituiforme]
MKIKRLVIENFKSIERIELIEPNPFTVFVGPNGSGKSNIFEALEFVNFQSKNDKSTGVRLFGGADSILNRKISKKEFSFKLKFDSESPNHSEITFSFSEIGYTRNSTGVPSQNNRDYFFETGNWENYKQFYDGFGRLFVGNNKILKVDFQDNEVLNANASNLEEVLERILSDRDIIDEFEEWLTLFIPGFLKVEVRTDNIGGTSTLLIYEQGIERPFTKALISDGTYNILALLTAIYQSTDEPQFLCIEEPENGLNPKVVKELVNLCRYACEEFGHRIWLNTHSQSLVSQLTPDEIILVDKKEGATQIKQIKGMNLHDLPMDEAWLTNALGGGLPW